MGRVVLPRPATKKLVTKSSKEIVNASRAPARIAGRAMGSVTLRKAEHDVGADQAYEAEREMDAGEEGEDADAEDDLGDHQRDREGGVVDVLALHARVADQHVAGQHAEGGGQSA